MELVHKGGLIQRDGIDVDAALVPAKVSVLEIDRDNEVTVPQGFRHRAGLASFKVNPTVFFGHASFGLPIGKAATIKLHDDHIAAVTKMAVDVQGPVGDHVRGVFDLMTQGFLNAWSVGFWFDDVATEKDAMVKILEGIGNDAARAVLAEIDTVRRIFTRNRLAEYSAVGIGSSPSSLTERGYTGHDLAPEIIELLEFGAKYDVARDGDWQEWLRYTESANIDVDAAAVTDLDVVCEVIDACVIDLDTIAPATKTGADDKPGGVVINIAPGTDPKDIRAALVAAGLDPAKTTDGGDIAKTEPVADIRPRLQDLLDKAGIAVVWHAGEIALQIALDDDDLGAKVVVPISGDTLAAINAKADTMAELAVLEELTGGAG